MGIGLEQLADGSTSDRNFQKLQALVPDTGGVSLGVRVGGGTATWTASNVSADVTVTHGLGRTPVFADAKLRGGSTSIEFEIVSTTATTMVVRGYTTGGASITFSNAFGWVAIG